MPERGFYLLVYDIADTRRRNRIARAMEAVSERVQESVFEAYLSGAERDDLLRRVRKTLDPTEDSLRVYQLCSECRGKTRTLGQGSLTPPPGVRIV